MTTRTLSILTIAAGVLLAGGSLLPWISARSGFGSVDVTGIEGDGVGTLVAGALIALLGLLYFDRPLPNAARLLVLLGAVISLGIVATDYQDVQERIANIDSDAVSGSVGTGLYVAGLGVVLAFVSLLSTRGKVAGAADT